MQIINTQFSPWKKYENQILYPTSFRINNNSNNKSPLHQKKMTWSTPKICIYFSCCESTEHTEEKQDDYFQAQTNYRTHLLKGLKTCVIRIDSNTKGFQMKQALKFTGFFRENKIPQQKPCLSTANTCAFKPCYIGTT